MNSSAKYYREKLYPFQDGVLNIVKKSGTPFYLTGGTALSRGYFDHRYSDDLDLFVNQDDSYSSHVQTLFRQFESAQSKCVFSIDYNRLQKYEHFTQFFLFRESGNEKIDLKIDLINDIASHYGGFERHAVLGVTDSVQNILSNKLSAIFRYEAKDIADVWVIAKNRKFEWMSAIQEAKTKEAGMDPIAIFNILKSFPEGAFSTVKWTIPVDFEVFKKDIDQIAGDILRGSRNTLFLQH